MRALRESGHKPMFEYIPKTSTQEQEQKTKKQKETTTQKMEFGLTFHLTRH